MRLLGIIVALLALFYASQVLAESHDEACNSVRTNDLLSCASDKLKVSDARLNRNYRKAQLSVETAKASLKDVQVSWLRFRDEYCHGIYEETKPGNEANIEKALCMALLTSDRADEIERLYAQSEDRGFYRALSALERAGYDRTELIEKLQSSSSEDKAWSDYVSQNCRLQNKITKEEERICKARTNFYRSY